MLLSRSGLSCNDVTTLNKRDTYCFVLFQLHQLHYDIFKAKQGMVTRAIFLKCELHFKIIVQKIMLRGHEKIGILI